MTRAVIAYIPSSHMDLFWLGNYKTCLERGAQVIRQYLDRCLEAPDETFFLETTVFADYFLQRFPEYREHLVRLVHEGRVEVGAVYVDRWETLILAESLVRNIQFGQAWCREALGIRNPTVTHPDLPSMVPQIAQIYGQAGCKYYVTSRKIYRDGQVWRHQAPDGSAILVMNWPLHYVFAVFDHSDVPPEWVPKLWTPPMEIEKSLHGFPLGMVPVAGGAGDLTDRESFRDRYSQYLEGFVADYRQKYTDYDFTYTTPSTVLAPYEDYADIPLLRGELPSVWGVAADEEAAFFRRDRQIEARLLTAETLALAADQLGLSWRPPSADGWQGTFFEEAFFQRKDPIMPGKELEELWRMHVFTQDHNGGGQEGALSVFQKRVIQERCLKYTAEIIEHTFDQIAAGLTGAGDVLLAFNPNGEDWSGPLALTVPAERWAAGSQLVDAAGQVIPSQVEHTDGDTLHLWADLPPVPSLGYRAFAVRAAPTLPPVSSVQVQQNADTIHIQTPYLELAISRRTGNLEHLIDRTRGQTWSGAPVGRLYTIAETGNDVTLRIRPDAPTTAEHLLSVEVAASGPLFTQVLVRKRLLKCEVEQTITVWADKPRLDYRTTIYWWGAHNLQVRLGLPTAAKAGITYGSAFYGVGWTEVAQEAYPRNPDELLREDHASYREVQGWLYLCGDRGGLGINTIHPAFHHGANGLEAVLLRTSPSCGDRRFFWENAGRQDFDFTLWFGDSDWKTADAQRIAALAFRSPVCRMVTPGGGTLPPAHSLLRVEGALLSSAYPGPTPGSALVRVFETVGRDGAAVFSGPLAEASAGVENLLGETMGTVEGVPGRWRVDLPAWSLHTLRFTR